jgi:hypothetical protein
MDERSTLPRSLDEVVDLVVDVDHEGASIDTCALGVAAGRDQGQERALGAV